MIEGRSDRMKEFSMKRSIFSLASAVLGSIYLLAGMFVFSINGVFYDAIVHMVLAAVAVAANWASFLYHAKNGILASAIAYGLSAVAFLPYGLFLLIPIGLSCYTLVRMRGGSAAAAQKTPQAVPAVSAQDVVCRLRLEDVSVRNPDGVSRQALLRSMRLHKPPFDGGWDIELQQYRRKDADVIGVLVNGYLVGNLPKRTVPYIMTNWSRISGIADFQITGGERAEDGARLHYGAELYLQIQQLTGPSEHVSAPA